MAERCRSDVYKRQLVRKAFIEHGRIIFNGNGYEEAWVEEAARRGLANLRSTADALPTYVPVSYTHLPRLYDGVSSGNVSP